MKKLPVYTISELLATPAIQHNQTRLAKLLHITRGSLRKYMRDTDNKFHSVLFIDGKYIFQHSNEPHPNRRIQ